MSLLLRSLVLLASLSAAGSTTAADLKLLFMGDNGHHRPVDMFHEIAPVLEKRGVEMKYTDRMEDLTPETLAGFDGLVLYANIDRIEDAQAKAVLDYVAGGKAFIPIHCATFCWRNNSDIVKLMGGQFQKHGAQVFGTQIAEATHPIMKGFSGFSSFDETYIHHLHNEENRTVLEYRVEGGQADGKNREPWTWVRTQGKGRVFYTAWGHDERTWKNPGFTNLVERGIRWACGTDVSVVPVFADLDAFTAPKMTELTKDVAPFEFLEVGPKIPNYTPGRQWGVQGAPKTTMQLPLSPEESMKHYSMPEGMALRLYADERNFESKPISMNWDERGRLWICETLDYPNELGKDRDRIRICEDTDGDNVADKFTIFAEGLSIPTAIMIYRGGAVVQNAAETLYLKDTDGDDKADQKTVLITGWAAGDTHGGVSNFRYGLDNWIWGMQGYNDSTPEYNGHKSQSFRQGFWRFKMSQDDPPVVTDLEFVRSTNNNTWGLGITEEGLIFGSTANHNPSTFVAIPNRYYEKVRGWAAPDIGTIADTYMFKPITENIRQVDQFGGYTAGAGHALYTARTFPQQWWNKTAFVCGPTGHLVGTFVLHRDGTGYKSTSPTNLLASDDEWAAPIMAEVGPDGAVWVIDWYNYIIQHNPTPQGFKTGKGNAYESDLRDKKHGRIYRVVPTTADKDKLHEWSSLATASNLDLVQVLKHPSFNWRLQAQRLLVEKNATDVVPQLLTLIADQSVDGIGLNVGAIHALWTLKGLGVIDGERKTVAAVSAAEQRSAVALGVNPAFGATNNAKGSERRRAVITASVSVAPSGLSNSPASNPPGSRPGLPAVVLSGLHRSAWTPTSVASSDPAVLTTLAVALKHSSAGVRRNAIAVLPRDAAGMTLLFENHPALLFDEKDPQVLLQLFLTLSEMPVSNEATMMILGFAHAGITDQGLADAVTVAASVHCTKHLRAFWGTEERVAVRGDGVELRSTVQLTPASSLPIVRIVAEHLGRTRPGTKDIQAFLDDIKLAAPPIMDAALEGIIAGLPPKFEFTTNEEVDAGFTKLLKESTVASRSRVVKLASLCGSKALESYSKVIVESLLKVVTDADSTTEARINAGQEAVGFQSENTDVLTTVLGTISLQTTPDLAVGLIEAAGLSTASDAGKIIVDRMDQMTPSMKATAVRILLSRPATTTALLAAVKAGSLDIGDLTLDQKQALRVHPDKTIRAAAEKLMVAGGGLPDADREKVLQSLLPLCEEKGDVKVGKAIFVKHCSKCHMHGTEGKTIGPNLTGMAVHPKHELLMHIIDPSRSVEGNFRIYTVVKTDGIVLNGMMSGESRTTITLLDAEAKEHQIAREDIEELVRSRKSLMPEGFEKQVTPEELSSLLEFLTDKGKFMPISLDRYATAISTKGLFHEGDDGPDRMVFGDWTPKILKDIPFILTDPRGKSVPNIILLNGPNGTLPPTMPKTVTLPCNSEAKAIHLLSGVGGWSFPYDANKTVSMIVRLHYKGGETEDIELLNGVHFADYIRRVDVPGSEFAFALGGQQIRNLTVTPKKRDIIETIELVKGPDRTAPIVMALTVERI
ncbi:MAG: ThuA domain-containing protein [Planctomycetota bacterium]|nr:ThuA domain-containing protein [Planctomycetota bacterium]